MSRKWGLWGAAIVGLYACGDDPAEGGPNACMVDADCASAGMGYVCVDGSCVAPVTTTGGEGSSEESSSSGEPTAGTAAMTDSNSGSPTGDPSGPDTTGGGGPPPCDPSGAPFILGDDMVLRASIAFNFGAPSCGAASGASPDPHIVLEVQPTGLINATSFGIEITESSHGQLFMDPPIGDSNVIQLMSELDFVMEGMEIGGGSTFTLEFRVSEMGPSLGEVAVEFT